MRFYLLTAAVFFCGLVGIALAGAAPDDAAPQAAGCHGQAVQAAPAAASCHGDNQAAASCHGRTTFAERRASRISARADARSARADARAEKASARGCHGQQAAKASCHGQAAAAPAPACDCPEDCSCRN
jgi:hypothetical protein